MAGATLGWLWAPLAMGRSKARRGTGLEMATWKGKAVSAPPSDRESR